jgi:hypothetical protein
MVQADSESFVLEIWRPVDFGLKDLAQKARANRIPSLRESFDDTSMRCMSA